MKRRNFRAVVTDNSGNTFIGERDTFAWNSAIKATEAITREYARAHTTIYHGGRPVVMEDPERIYRREWTSSTGQTLRALVWEVV
jgi:hypothetical protein